MPADDVESGLRDLIRDLRPTKVGGEEPQKRETQHTEMRSRQARWHGMVELRNSTVHELWLQVLSLEGVTTGHLSRFQAGREPACTLC